MNSILHVNALFRVRVKTTFKNMEVFMLFLVFPCIAVIMQQVVGDTAGMEGSFFTGIFGVMHCVFAPLMAMASFLSEEKEKHTLKVLLFANISLREYLFSTGGFVCLATLFTSLGFVAAGGYNMEQTLLFLGYTAVGCVVSVVLGSCIGLSASSMAAANGMAVPCGMLLAFLPMLANFNETISKVAEYTYGQQIGLILSGAGEVSAKGNLIIAANLLVFAVIAAIMYRRNKMLDI